MRAMLLIALTLVVPTHPALAQGASVIRCEFTESVATYWTGSSQPDFWRNGSRVELNADGDVASVVMGKMNLTGGWTRSPPASDSTDRFTLQSRARQFTLDLARDRGELTLSLDHADLDIWGRAVCQEAADDHEEAP